MTDFAAIDFETASIQFCNINALRNHTLEELSHWVGSESLQDHIPPEYQLPDMPLLWLKSDCYRGIEDAERMNLFNLYT